MNYPGRNTCQRAALVLALVSLISAMMLPGLSLSRAAGVRTTPALTQPATSSAVALRETADFDGTSGQLPDPKVWQQTGTINPVPFQGVGLAIVDPDNASSLQYFHPSLALGGAQNANNTATFRVTVRTPQVDNASPAWTNDMIGYRISLDDGSREMEVALGRDGGTLARQLVFPNSAAQAIPFSWDNDLFNTYEIRRLTTGEFTIQPISADPGAPIVAPVKINPGLLPISSGAGFSWGMGAGGGATSIWHAVHGEVNSVTCFDPVPNPINAGWTQEGNGSFQPGTPLLVSDPSNAPGDCINFFCADPSLFSGNIVLTPHFSIASFGQAPAADGNTGIHVTINDGAKFARAFVLQMAPGAFKVALALAGGGYSNGFPLVGSTGDFTLERRTDGSAILSVPNPVVGSPALEETILAVDLADSLRLGVKTLEFGTAANVQATSQTNWDTLGLPRNLDFPIGLTVDEMRLMGDNNDKIRFRAAFTLGPSSDGINPVTEPVTLMMSNAMGQFYSANLPAGSFCNERPVRWALTDAARQSSGIERFDILQDKKEVFFVDRRTTLPSGSFANVSLTLVIGNDSGTGSVVLVERPAGSGRWRNK